MVVALPPLLSQHTLFASLGVCNIWRWLAVLYAVPVSSKHHALIFVGDRSVLPPAPLLRFLCCSSPPFAACRVSKR